MSNLIISFQLCTRRPSQFNKGRIKNRRHTDWKVRNKIEYVENSKNLARLQDTKSTYPNPLCFCILSVINWNIKILNVIYQSIKNYIGIHASEYVHDHYTEKHTTLLREIKEVLNKFREISQCVRFG